MELILDTANLAAIERAIDLYPIDGVTTNPTLLANEGRIDVLAHLKTIQTLIGRDRSLHVQTLSDTAEGIVNEAKVIKQHLGSSVYVKIPATPQGIKAMKQLHALGVRMTATTVLSKLQATLAINAGADFLAPYVNRMENLDIDAMDVVSSIKAQIISAGSKAKIVAASFKNLAQINGAIEAGVHAVTLNPDLLDSVFSSPALAKAVGDFKSDFERIHGEGVTFTSL